MTDTADRTTTSADPVDEVKAWLADNWDPDLTVAEWWDRLGASGWGVPTWPSDWFGKDLSRAEGVRVQQAIADFGALPAPGGLGLMLAGPTIAVHGDDEQKTRYLRDIVTGQKAWCQLFSEPGAGSDLAGLDSRAVKDGEEWIVNGQKVWTSGGHVADLGMLIARTDPDQPKHAGITYFVIDMHQPGVDVRPAQGDDRPGAVQRGLPRRRPRRATTPSSAASTTAGGSPTPRSCSSGPASARAAARPPPRSPAPARSPATSAAGPATSCRAAAGAAAGGGTLFGASSKALVKIAQGQRQGQGPGRSASG